MKVKKYIAEDMQKAFSMIKEDLGKDAVILSSQRVRKRGLKGYFSKPVFEVIAAVDEDKSKTRFNDELNIKKLEFKINELQDLLISSSKNGDKSVSDHILVQKLKEEGISDKVIELIKNDVNFDDDELYVDKISDIMLGILGQPDLIKIETRPTTVLFIGPTGVGKTTTIAKLAANLVLKEKCRVALLTMDTYRIAAVEQLKKYGDILGIPTTVINSPLEYTSAIKELKDYDVVLIDTAGRNHKNEYQLDEIKSLLKISKMSKIYLVLSLTAKDRDLIDIVNRYDFIDDFTILFTKQDETASIGGIINICFSTGKKISYVTNGQRVPDDIMVFNPKQYVNALLRR
ncbi:MAG: 50S ribosome-binding GTPase [Thermoanaerobacteraceae bacterium]|nr:50S ribosome-binding GTPase [Thermoanaerobacteraceae bacterium]